MGHPRRRRPVAGGIHAAHHAPPLRLLVATSERRLVDADAHDLTLDPFIAIIRFDDRLYFGAAGFFEDRVLEALVRLPELRYLILDAGGINQIDATGVQTLARRAGPS